MQTYDFDLIIIGGGGAGITAAVLASGLGKKVALLDKGKFGGECTWSGCVPSKALLHAAKTAHAFHELSSVGIKIQGKTSLNTSGVMNSVRDVIKTVYAGETPEHFKKSGIRAVENAKICFLDPYTVEVNGKKMTAAKFIIATGSSPVIPPIPGLDKISFYTNETIFNIKKIPGTMSVLGGGPIGVELASAFTRLGTKVTLIEMADRPLFREDAESSELITQVLKKEGVTVLTGTKVVEARKSASPVLVCEQKGKKKNILSEIVLVAVGRKPNIENLNLENAGVRFDRTGITVNSKMRTSTPNIYAAGDVAGPYQFSHMANSQAIVAATNALLPISKKMSYKNVPWVTFTDPELARCGLTEEEAREKYGNSIKIFRTEYSDTDRGKTDRTGHGFAKVICTGNRKIAGIHIAGPRAGELMQQLLIARTFGMPLDKLNSIFYAYPGYSDVIKNLARQAYVDKISNNPVVKLIKLIRGSK